MVSPTQGPIANRALTTGFDLDCVVVLPDAETVQRRERHPVVAQNIRRQPAAADMLVLNKIDLLSPDDRATVDTWLARAAPRVPLLHARDGEAPLAVLAVLAGVEHPAGPPVQHSDHGDECLSVSLTIEEPVPQEQLDRFLDQLPSGVLRVKGLLRLNDSPECRTVLQAVANRRRISTAGPWVEGELGRLVLIALAGTPGLHQPEDLVHALFSWRSASRPG